MADTEAQFWADANAMRHRAFANDPGLSDQHRADERRALEIVMKARAEFDARILDAMVLTSLMASDLEYLRDAISDNCPTRDRWEAKIRGE